MEANGQLHAPAILTEVNHSLLNFVLVISHRTADSVHILPSALNFVREWIKLYQ
jgi:hypothetical protein